MIIYQLMAHGHSAVTGQVRTVASKKAHKTEKKALEEKKEFTKSLTTPEDDRDLGYLDKKNLRIHVAYIELID